MSNKEQKEKEYPVGFIGQGFVGKNQADDFERRGYKVVRFALEKPFIQNKDKIKDCEIVFIAVPTPTTPEGFDYGTIRKVLPLVGRGKIAVIKSTVLPGVTEALQEEFPHLYIIHSPEFLSEATASRDAAFPTRNIVGIPSNSIVFRRKAEQVLSILPNSPYNRICSSREAEFIKYARNCAGYVRVIFSNILYDAVKSAGSDWRVIEEAMGADPDNGPIYLTPLHKTGRGAGGHCFIKDFSAFRSFYDANVTDDMGKKVLQAIEAKNIDLLERSGKDLDLLHGVYGRKLASDKEYVTTKKDLKAKTK